jgi:Xaa-Pro aminopeptidase
MSKRDFTPEEFSSRRSRVRAAMSEAGLDWLLMFHPMSLHRLTGSQELSGVPVLIFPKELGPVVVLTREGNEIHDDALVDDVWCHDGGEPEDPIAVFAKLAASLGLISGGVGMECRPTTCAHTIYVRLKSRSADTAMSDFAQKLEAGRSELELAGKVYASLLSMGSGLAASPIKSRLGRALGVQPWSAN